MIYAAVLVGSLVGSLHCIAMCGPLVAVAAGRHSLHFAVLHACGRLLTYVMLGAAAGVVGRAVNVAGQLGTIQHIAAILAAVTIVVMGVSTIAVAKGWWRTRTRPSTTFGNGLVALRRRPPAARAYLAGVLTGLIPCGWLWAFVVSAAGTGSALQGAAIMAVFWLGTVPAMTGLLVLAAPVVTSLRSRLPIVTAVALITLGLGTLALRWNDAGQTGVTQPSCHVENPG